MSKSKLDNFREVLKNNRINAYIIPTSDPHKSEYIADYWKLREWLTNFSGSAGTAVITQTHAGLWTDSRYFIQAEEQLTTPFILHKLKTRQPEYVDWLFKELNFNDTIGINPQLFSDAEIETLKNKFEAKQIKIKATNELFNNIWQDRPPLPDNKIFIHDTTFSGMSRTEKIKNIISYLKKNNSEQILITALDDIAWLLNLRGNDIKYNPVFYAFVLLNFNECYLFIDNKKISPEVKASLNKDKITIKPYSEIESYLKNISGFYNIEVDIETANYSLTQCIPPKCKIKANKSIITKLKSIKNKIEIKHYKNAQIRDGISMCNFLFWLNENINTKTITEIDAAEKAKKFRSIQDNYISLSFETISAYQKNAAIPHYTPNTLNPVILKPEGLYLIDSGAQYLDGTTDITRTVALGKVSDEQKTDFTLVLKGHIRLSTTKFPYGTKGYQLDALARLDLWNQNKDYGHGTGHGIGYFLNVHEGPQSFAQSHIGHANTIIEPGMCITNEPGIYIEGKYGIRTENVLVCVEDKTTPMGKFLKFETVTYCPIDKNLIDITLLNKLEIEWLNSYHKKVYELISPNTSSAVLAWLKEKTLPLVNK